MRNGEWGIGNEERKRGIGEKEKRNWGKGKEELGKGKEENIQVLRLCRDPCGRPLAYRRFLIKPTREAEPRAFLFYRHSGEPEAHRTGSGKAASLASSCPFPHSPIPPFPIPPFPHSPIPPFPYSPSPHSPPPLLYKLQLPG